MCLLGVSMPVADRAAAYLVVGAGSSGLVALKSLRALGLAAEAVEREDDVGGNWYFGKPHSSVAASTHLISSKALTEYTDFPFPAQVPEFPSHRQALDYLRAYTDHFGLRPHIEFNTRLQRLEPVEGGWRAVVQRPDGGVEDRRYRGVVIANGHNWDPRWPELPGQFSGSLLHACQYKTPDVLRGRRVLVIGGGNSGCDIAVDAAHHAAEAWISLRRGYHYLPKFWRGRPIDAVGERLQRWHAPLWLRRGLAQVVVRLTLGAPEQIGLPRPDHRLFETHPIINSQLPYHVAHGRIGVKPDVAELRGPRVVFRDGSELEPDVIVCATGYRVTIPFIDPALLRWRDGGPDLYLNVFHPERDDLFVAGLIQPDSGQWGLVDLQSQAIARFAAAVARGGPAAAWFRGVKSGRGPDLSGGVRYLASPRHRFEVDHYGYRRRLERLLGEFTRRGA